MNALGITILILAASCHADGAPRATQRHTLPGFSLALPEGTVREDKSSAYGEGKYSLGVQGSWVVLVEWSPGPLSESDRGSYRDAWKLDLDHPLPIRASVGGSETFAGTNHGPARVTFVPCGHRHIVVASITGDDVDALHAGVVATFQCTPDAKQERQAGARIELADRAGWQRASWQRAGAGDEVVTLVREGGTKVLMSFYYAHKPDRATLERLVAPFGGRLGDGEPHPLSGPGLRGWVRTLSCSTANWVVVLYIDAGSGDVPRATVDGVRCLRPDEPDVAWPPAPPELQKLLP